MATKEHWENIHRTKPAELVSWYRPHLDLSLSLIEQIAPQRAATIIDIGAGQSSLTGDLLERGYQNLTVLDIAGTAISKIQKQLGSSAAKVRWIEADVLLAALEEDFYDVWHDRAVFHFLTDKEQRAVYVRKVVDSLKAGGHVVINTFACDGPQQCSGLSVARYDAESLDREFGPRLKRINSAGEVHRTPSGAAQNFFSAVYRLEK